MTPLAIPDPVLVQPDPQNDWLAWLPFFGWSLVGSRQINRMGRAKAGVRQQLEQRNAFPIAAWQSCGLNAFQAAAIAQALPTRLSYLPNYFFLPDDPLALLTLVWEGSVVGLFEADLAVWQHLHVRITANALRNLTQNRTLFSDFVAAVWNAGRPPDALLQKN